ncbi:DUF21-domain-containing protein [Coprinopsis marcescibilis]|uniref:DUF21-domain-containing protein n=1 Tax=Coprinopsis marcescibilis TaxID=230819 RepID=A0A5C3KVG4_COPMA|nr:DUF21-domain-containing protein [Coprinopsis marcescibilis]
MVPVPSTVAPSRYARLLHILITSILAGARGAKRALTKTDSAFLRRSASKEIHTRSPEIDKHNPRFIVFATLIPVLVLLSGLFAGLTLGYMSLDETQLNVLSISGTPEQRIYANKIKPIRKNGHRLLVTLLLANMIVNETLPVIADPVLGGGVPGVVVSTVLIVIFAEIIPQSLFTRHGLYLGAKMAGLTNCLMNALFILAWPVATILELVLGHHHGIIYRRAELKELIALHSASATHGGDLKVDTVNIIGSTLDLQEKVVKQAMTSIEDVFMLSADAKLDYGLLKRICETGHSRIPVYEEIDIPAIAPELKYASSNRPHHQFSGCLNDIQTLRVKKIVGTLLVKSCVLLDPSDAVPIRNLPLNRVPFVGQDEPLLSMLARFQEGRSHIAVVTHISPCKAESVARLVEREIMGPLRQQSGEQGMPTDAALHAEQAQEVLQTFDPVVMPLGIITLEDVLEELIGEEIYDEFDSQTTQHILPPPPDSRLTKFDLKPSTVVEESMSSALSGSTATYYPSLPSAVGFLRSKSAPPTSRTQKLNEETSNKSSLTHPSSSCKFLPFELGSVGGRFTDALPFPPKQAALSTTDASPLPLSSPAASSPLGTTLLDQKRCASISNSADVLDAKSPHSSIISRLKGSQVQEHSS